MCVLLLNIHNFFDVFEQLAIDWKFGLSIDRTTDQSVCAIYGKMVAQTVCDLESVIFILPLLLCERERHFLSDNIDMHGFFC